MVREERLMEQKTHILYHGHRDGSPIGHVIFRCLQCGSGTHFRMRPTGDGRRMPTCTRCSP